MAQDGIHPKMKKLTVYMTGKALFDTYSTYNAPNSALTLEYNINDLVAYSDTANKINENDSTISKFRNRSSSINYQALRDKKK